MTDRDLLKAPLKIQRCLSPVGIKNLYFEKKRLAATQIAGTVKINPQKKFLPALMILKEAVECSSVTKLLKCQTAHRNATSFLKELNANEIKESLLFVIENDLQSFGMKSEESDEKDFGLNIKDQGENKSYWEKVAQVYLEGIVKKITTYLKNKWTQKQIYKYIIFKWHQGVVDDFVNSLTLTQSTVEGREEKQTKEEGKQGLSIEIWNQRQIFDCIGKIDNKPLANQLYTAFHFVLKSLKQKETDLAACMQCNAELEDILKEQMRIIAFQKEEQQQNNEHTIHYHEQLTKITERCKNLENQLVLALEGFQNFKRQEFDRKKGYYINPLFEKNQLQEKYMSQIIQLQSDLLLEKGQVKTLVDLFVDQTMTVHSRFFNLGANRYFVSKYDRDFWKKIKYLKSFDGINWDEVLMLKQQNQETDCSHLMHRSNISTFSSIELQNNGQVLVQECFSPFGQTL